MFKIKSNHKFNPIYALFYKKDFKPSSAFDVKQLNTNEIRRISSYVTKYITKNNDKFKCQVWNCSRKVSELYTDFYTSKEFTDQFIKLNAVTKENNWQGI